MSVNSGFSKFNRKQRIEYLVNHSELSESDALGLNDFDAPNSDQQHVISEMIENHIGNFPLPMGVVSNMLINDQSFTVPFVTEESSVIAAASKASKFWAERGGFKAKIEGLTKKGQVHFTWNGNPSSISSNFKELKSKINDATSDLTSKMEQRGGGIKEIKLLDKTAELPNYYQLDVSFETANAMGANFINSCLEKMAEVLLADKELNNEKYQVEIIMSILSNYTPDCKVICWVECPIEKLQGWNNELTATEFALKFKQAVDIANLDISRAVTHNKGIFNGIDAVLMATGNDTRATAASGHAFASRSGQYRGLTAISLSDGLFKYQLELPIAIGTVGGITKIHPVVKTVMSVLNNPDAPRLMSIAAAAGLANNFAAVSSLITTGIQKGHMKMHLSNMLHEFKVTEAEKHQVIAHFANKTISFKAVEEYIQLIRNSKS